MSEAELDVHLSKCTERYIAALQDVPRLLYHQLLLYHSVAGTEDAVMMIEGFGDFLTVDEMLYAIEKGHEAVAKACKDIKAWAEDVGREKKTDKMLVPPEGVDAAVAEAVGPELATAMAIGPKQMRGAAVEKVRNAAMDALKDQFQVRVVSRDCAKRRVSRLSRIPLRGARTHRRALVASHSWGRGRAAQLPRAQSKPTVASNARSAHPGVAPGYFRRRRFARG